MATYKVEYCQETGELLRDITSFASLEYTKVVGDIGVCTLEITKPVRERFNDHRYAPALETYNLITRNIPDKRLHIYRNGRLEFVSFLQVFQYLTDRDGKESVKLIGFSPEMILARRVIAYYPEEAETVWNDNIETIMKGIVTDNLVDNADYSGTPDPTRSITTKAGFTVQADKGTGAVTAPDDMAWRYLLEVLKELQAASQTDGTEVFFTIAPTGPQSLQFQTHTGQPGVDRSYSGNSQSKVKPLLFSLKNGNLQEPELVYDFSDMATKVYAVTYDGFIANTAQNDTKIAYSPLGLREKVISSRGTTADEVAVSADDELARQRAKATLTARLLSTPGAEYGKQWNYGDKVTVEYRGVTADVIIRSVNVRVDENGQETITSRIEDLVYVNRTK